MEKLINYGREGNLSCMKLKGEDHCFNLICFHLRKWIQKPGWCLHVPVLRFVHTSVFELFRQIHREAGKLGRTVYWLISYYKLGWSTKV